MQRCGDHSRTTRRTCSMQPAFSQPLSTDCSLLQLQQNAVCRCSPHLCAVHNRTAALQCDSLASARRAAALPSHTQRQTHSQVTHIAEPEAGCKPNTHCLAGWVAEGDPLPLAVWCGMHVPRANTLRVWVTLSTQPNQNLVWVTSHSALSQTRTCWALETQEFLGVLHAFTPTVLPDY